MIRGANKAFTIIEVVLFIAISGLMILVAMNAIGSSQSEVQFTDSMRSLQSFIETQVSATTSGVNDTPVTGAACSNAGGTGCVMLGRVLIFTKDSAEIEYRSLLGERLTADYQDPGNCGSMSVLQCSNPEVELNQRIYDTIWASKFRKGEHLVNGSYVYSQAFGFVRNPRASTTSAMTFSTTDGDSAGNVRTNVINEAATYSSLSNTMVTGEEVDAYYCFESAAGGRFAVISILGSQVDLVFDEDEDFTYSCS